MGKEHKSSHLSILQPSIMKMPIIDWQLLAKAHSYYQQFFTYQETPYLVPEYYSVLTKPHNEHSFLLSQDSFSQQPHELVGSAEQGFIYLAMHKQLKSNRLFSISPCFRFDNYDETHFPWFMKLELFHLSERYEDIQDMINLALCFYEAHHEGQYQVVSTSDFSWDINLNGLEIGSYGLRVCPQSHLHFIYGTGLALPRFSQAKEYHG